MKSKLILVTVLALGSMAHAQGFLSHLSLGVGLQGVFPGTTFTKNQAETNVFNASSQTTTQSVGAVADARYEFGRHSAFDIAVTVNRNSELYFSSVQNLSRVQTNNTEVIGSYILRLPGPPHLRPYALIGGGMVHMSPNADFTTGGTPQSDDKPAFAYGFGADVEFNDSWALRLQYRGLVRGEPDFHLASEPFGTGLKTHVAEPSLQLVYHF